MDLRPEAQAWSALGRGISSVLKGWHGGRSSCEAGTQDLAHRKLSMNSWGRNECRTEELSQRGDNDEAECCKQWLARCQVLQGPYAHSLHGATAQFGSKHCRWQLP